METELEDLTINNESSNKGEPEQFSLQLGDIIELVSPRNLDYHETTNYVYYIDETHVKATNVSTLKHIQLNINDDGNISDETIEQIIVIDRSVDKGYARQNNLMPSTWVDIHFGGDIPSIITGQIINLEEDMIEIISYPEMETFYIDFKYRGIPTDIPIDKFIIREKPAAIANNGSLSLLKDAAMADDMELDEQEQPTIEFTENGESVITISENQEPDKNVRTMLHDLYTDANTITFAEELDEISQLVEVPENEQRYSIDIQVNDMMDELLSTIPNSQRTKQVLDNIHTLIARYTELRSQFSKFDENHNVYDKQIHTATYKPLVSKLESLNYNLKWIMPVVMNRKKIQNSDSTDMNLTDVATEDMTRGFSTIVDMKKAYSSKGANDKTITYNYIENMEQTVHTPFEEPLEKEECITTKQVMTNLEAVVDNLTDFYSTVYSDAGIKRTRFLIQRYNLGTDKIEENLLNSGKKKFSKGKMTENDTMCVKSFIMLPKSVIKFSEIALPTTPLLSRANLHDNYLLLFKLLKKNANVTSQVIDDLSKELDYDKIEAETKEHIFDGINEFVLNQDAAESMEYMDEDERFKRFLEIIIPKTRQLIRLYRKYIHHRLSFAGVVQKLEPFMIYPSDITYKQYMEIRFFIIGEIKNLKKNFSDNATKLNALSNTNYNVSLRTNSMLRILSEQGEFAETFFKTYRFLSKDQLDTKLSPAELLMNMMIVDNAELYTNMVSSILIRLNAPDNLLATIEQPNIDDFEEPALIKPEDCSRKYLAKKYTSIEKLQKDNNVDELFFESDYDDTPYELLNKYASEKKEMPTDTFFIFLVENLVSRHGVSHENAQEFAKTLIANKKSIVDGHYAMVEIIPSLKKDINVDALSAAEKESIDDEADIRKKVSYYRRLKNNWVRDDDIVGDSFIDTNTLFCNISEKCSKNNKNKICENSEQTKIRMKNTNIDSLKQEFDKRYQLSIEDLETKLTTIIGSQLKKIRRNEIIKEAALYRANNLAYEIGKLAKKEELLESPHTSLRELIMGQADFAKKQGDICRFAEQYCRDPLVDNLDESRGWLYCKDTNTKLFPDSIRRLASCYVSGENYQTTLDIICAEVGTSGDDGESIVDKYSGYVLKLKDLSTEEGYDINGRMVQSRDIIEQDLGVVMEDSLKKKDRIFETEQTEMIYNVANSICNNIDIPFQTIEDVVMRFSNILIENNIISENSYKRKSAAYENKTGKQLGSYINYKQEIIITIIGAVLLIAVQTSIPSIQTKKTYPSCIRSFSGYPMTGTEDMTGIEYISCVLVKMKSSIDPWTAMKKLNSEKLTIRMRDIIEKYIMPVSEIAELYVSKKEYVLLHPNTSVPEEHKLQKWVHFMPPVVPINIVSGLKNVSIEFKKEMLDKIKKGDPRQNTLIDIIKSKNAQHGIGIIEMIHKIVAEKDTLLKTSAQIPFVENACCNEKLKLTNPIIYFNEENGNIKVYLQRVSKNAKTIQDIHRLTSARMFFHNSPTGIIYPEVPVGYLEENVYHAFIHYCNFDKKLPVPSELKVVCNSAPEGYNDTWNMTEKIDFLKRNNRRFNINQLHQLMAIIRQRNMVDLFYREQITAIDGMKDMIDTYEMTDSEIVEEPLRKLIRAVINDYDPKKLYDTPNDVLDNLTNYLILANRRMYNNIMTFFDVNANTLTSQNFRKIGEFLLYIDSWRVGNDENDSINIHTISQFIKTAIHNISKVYPTILSNKADFYKNMCKHWGFSDYHFGDIAAFVGKFYKGIEKFKGDDVIVNMLLVMRTRLLDISLFVESIPGHTDIKKKMMNEKDELVDISFHSLFDEKTYYELLKFCFYRMILEYTQSSHDSDLLRSEVRQIAKTRRQHNNELDDPTHYISAANESVNENNIDILSSMEETEIITDTQEDLKSRISSLLVAFLEVEMENKATMNMSYNDIIKRINRSKEREKHAMINRLGNMSKEERKVEELFKTYKLGRWNVGLQKGLVSYDKETYERERGELLTQLYSDEDAGQYEVVSELRREIFDVENDDEEQQNAFYEAEANDITGLGEDYTDGIHYEEDVEDDL